MNLETSDPIPAGFFCLRQVALTRGFCQPLRVLVAR